MRAYVITTGIVFALLVVAHILRLIEEGSQLMKQPLSFSLPSQGQRYLCGR